MSSYILSSSNASYKKYPDNTLSKFKNDLPERSDSNVHGWKICVQSISLDVKFSNIPRSVTSNHHPIIVWKDYNKFVQSKPPDLIIQINEVYFASVKLFGLWLSKKIK